MVHPSRARITGLAETESQNTEPGEFMSIRVRHMLGSMCLCVVLAACGGGDDGGSSPPPTSPPPDGTEPPSSPPPAAVVTIEITTPPIDIEMSRGDAFEAVLEGTWSATDLGDGQVYLQVSDDAATFVVPGVQPAPEDSSFSYALPLAGELEPGVRTGLLSVRACADTLCTEPYPDSLKTVGYTLRVLPAVEWETMQGNAAHSGYVPVWLDPAQFTVAWEWQRPPGNEPLGFINAVVTSADSVYVSTDVYAGDGTLYCLDERNGGERWRVSFPMTPALNPPAISGNQVYITTTGHEDTHLWSFDADTGDFVFRAPFSSQWANVLAPTIYEDEVYTNGGYYGGVVYAFDRYNADPLWSASKGNDRMSTPAVDDMYVYHHSGTSLEVWDRATGATVASIVDPFGSDDYYDYHGAPMLGGRDNVIAFAGDAFSGRASSSTEQYGERVLSSFNIETMEWEWATQHAYITAPAVANGVIYAASKSRLALDAIDEETGEILWSWGPGPSQGDSSFHRNIVVTQNLLFVSTDTAVYALDLATRQPVWRYDEAGMLSLSSSTLYIATGFGRESDGGLVAIDLRR